MSAPDPTIGSILNWAQCMTMPDLITSLIQYRPPPQSHQYCFGQILMYLHHVGRVSSSHCILSLVYVGCSCAL